MIKALLLIFDPIATWERIVAAQRRWTFIFMIHFLPLLLAASVAEAYGLMRWGKIRGKIPHLKVFSQGEALIYESTHFILWIAIVFILARLIKALGETFHGRNTFSQAFTTAVYSLSPVLLMRLLDAFPSVSPWVTWGAGVSLSIAALYHGLPRVMLPDPPHAFGLYLSSAFLLIFITGLIRFLTALYLSGKFTPVDNFIANLIGQQP